MAIMDVGAVVFKKLPLSSLEDSNVGGVKNQRKRIK